MGASLASLRMWKRWALCMVSESQLLSLLHPCSLAPTSLVFLKCCLETPEGSLKPFQVHEVKTMFMITLGFYLLCFSNSSPVNGVWWSLTRNECRESARWFTDSFIY